MKSLFRSGAAWGFAAAVVAAIVLQYFHLGDALDRRMLDAQFKFLRAHYPRPVPNDVVVVGIDEDAYTSLREPFAMWHPHLGRFLHAMALSKPSVVGLDITLPDRSYHFLVPQYDQSLLQGLMEAARQVPVVLGQTMDDQAQFRPVFPPYVAVTGGDSLASVLICRDLADDVVRSFDGNLCEEGTQATGLAEKMADRLGLAAPRHGWIDFSVGDRFGYVPLLKVLEWEQQNDMAQLAKVFGGRPVLLGLVTPFNDRLRAPVPLAAWEADNRQVPGVLLHAQILRSMQSRGLVQEAPAWVNWLLMLAATLFWFGYSGWRKAGILAAAALTLVLLALTGLWHSQHLALGAPLLAAAFAFGGRLGHDALVQMRERRLLRGTFGSYVSPQVMQEIMAGNIKPGLGGARTRVCILFSDIRNFTTRSENMEPEEVIAMLNGYFTEMTAAIHRHGGTVDKFIGDGLMAFFGAPQQMESAEKHAFAAAQEMLARLERVNRQLKDKGWEPIQIGVGLHAGEVVIGHVGSELRHEYTAIGDAVNVAARLEGLCKDVGHPVVCSEAVAAALGRTDGLEELGQRAIKGHSVVRVFGWGGPLAARVA